MESLPEETTGRRRFPRDVTETSRCASRSNRWGTGTFRWSDEAGRKDMPDVVKNYEAQITDRKQRVYINLEATGEGTIYKIDFKRSYFMISRSSVDRTMPRMLLFSRGQIP